MAAKKGGKRPHLEAKLRELESAHESAVVEQRRLTLRRPELASAGLVGGDLAAQSALGTLNQRLLILGDLIGGLEFDLTQTRVALAEVAAEEAESERATRRLERDVLLAARNDHMKEAVKLVAEAGVLMRKAVSEHTDANHISSELNERETDWRAIVRPFEAAIRVHLDGGKADIHLASRMTKNEAARVLQASA